MERLSFVLMAWLFTHIHNINLCAQPTTKNYQYEQHKMPTLTLSNESCILSIENHTLYAKNVYLSLIFSSKSVWQECGE